MSYACGQYEDAFEPKKLRNWCCETNYCKTCQRRPRVQQFRGPEHLSFIADDNGHLLPCYKARFRCPPQPDWGPKVLSVWDQTEADYDKKLARLEKYRRRAEELRLPRYYNSKQSAETTAGTENARARVSCQQQPRFFEVIQLRTEQQQPPESYDKKTQFEKAQFEKSARQALVNRAFDQFRELKLPVIWVCGYPNEHTYPTRSDVVKQLVHRLGFVHLDIDDELTRLLELGEKQSRNQNLNLLKEFRMAHYDEMHLDKRPDRTRSYNNESKLQIGKGRGDQDAEILFKSNPAQYDRDSQRSTTNVGVVQNQKSRSTKSTGTAIKGNNIKAQPPQNAVPFHMTQKVHDVCLERLTIIAQRARGGEETQETLNVDGLIEILKMLMLLTYPTNGYVIDYFPATFEEAIAFDTNIWEASCGVYFAYFHGPEEVRINEGYFEPTLARRVEPYDDLKLEEDLAPLGERFVKIYFDHAWRNEQMEYVNCLVDSYLGRGSCQGLLSTLKIAAAPGTAHMEKNTAEHEDENTTIPLSEAKGNTRKEFDPANRRTKSVMNVSINTRIPESDYDDTDYGEGEDGEKDGNEWSGNEEEYEGEGGDDEPMVMDLGGGFEESYDSLLNVNGRRSRTNPTQT